MAALQQQNGRTAAQPNRVECSSCSVRELCLPQGLSAADVAQLERVVGIRRRVRRAQELYHARDPFGALYAIRLGSFKTRVTTIDGREQVTGFQMAGDLLGMDGIGTGRYSTDAVALEDSEACVMPFDRLEELSRTSGALQTQLHRVMSREIVRDQGVMLLLGNMRAEERVATFLLSLSERFRARSFSASAFVLRMSRQEIGSYLGLKLETVSRVFSRLREQGLVEVEQREIRLRDEAGLRQMVESCAGAH